MNWMFSNCWITHIWWEHTLLYWIVKNYGSIKQLSFKKGAGRKNKPELTFFAMFSKHFGDQGCIRKKGETGIEYFYRLKQIELIKEEFDDMLNYYYSVKYEDSEQSHAAEKEFMSKIKQL